MLNQDHGAIITDLQKRVAELERQVAEIKNHAILENQNWDNSTLMREWGICERTAANYRKNGLQYYKRGGRVYYTPEARESFEEKNKDN